MCLSQLISSLGHAFPTRGPVPQEPQPTTQPAGVLLKMIFEAAQLAASSLAASSTSNASRLDRAGLLAFPIRDFAIAYCCDAGYMESAAQAELHKWTKAPSKKAMPPAGDQSRASHRSSFRRHRYETTPMLLWWDFRGANETPTRWSPAGSKWGHCGLQNGPLTINRTSTEFSVLAGFHFSGRISIPQWLVLILQDVQN
jgi:hypothetical protein